MNSFSLQNKIIMTIILFVLFYALLAIYSDVTKIKDVFQHINLYYIIPMLSVLTFSMFLRSILQRELLSNIGIQISVKESFMLFLSGLSMIITPGGSGQMIKSHFIKKNYGYNISKSLPIVFAERFYDFVAIIIILIMTLFFSYSIESVIIIFISSILLIVIFGIIKNNQFFYKPQSILLKIPLLQKIIRKNPEFDESLKNLFHVKLMPKISLLALMAFFLEGFVIYLGFLSFSLNLEYLQTLQVFYTSVLFGTLSFIPGGVGVFEIVFIKLLTPQNIELSIITSLIIFIRLVTMWYATIIGFISSYFIMHNRRDKLEEK